MFQQLEGQGARANFLITTDLTGKLTSVGQVASSRNLSNTDWAQVKINTLREHLVDMELLTTQVVVSQVNEGDKTIFLIGGNLAAVEAAKRMVPAHSEELKNNQGWDIESSVTDEEIRMMVSPTKYIPTDKIRGLGFFGIMSIGAHFPPILPLRTRFFYGSCYNITGNINGLGEV